MSVSRHHADWLSLVESSGPFVSLPVLLRAFPQGLDPRDPEQAKQLRLAYEEWQENPNLVAIQRAWVMHVLTQVLVYPKELLAEGQTLPPGLTATMAEYGEILRPELALLGPMGSELVGKPQLLISLYPVEQSLDKPVIGKHWKATPGTRMMELLHATDVPLGLVTNGEEWMLVFAPRGDTTGFTSWYASLWIDEPITLRAFHSLLSTRRFFGVAPSDTLLGLLRESAQDQQEVTNQLGDQVRDAVEVLIQAFDRLDQDSGRTLLKCLDEKSLYDAALTVMMRLVFLFSAEERGLLHLNEPLYDGNYAVSTLREQLQEVADHFGEEILERRSDGWARLLATFRAVHGGVNHQDLMLPAYGGSLFDPNRYPFLEGRGQGTEWQTNLAAPLEINNRVVLHLLKSLQVLQVKVPGGGPGEARRVSFRALDIEQIGHIYEGLLDYTAVRAQTVVLGLAGSRKKPVASMVLSELEALLREGESKLIEILETTTDRSPKTLEKALQSGGDLEDLHEILLACGQSHEVAQRVCRFHRLLRYDSFERPVIVLPNGIYVGEDSTRRSSSTHYTPRSLTEPVVRMTLEPLVYSGPAEGYAKNQWRLKSPREILDLKICDLAMGSGAFLVQACRYLSERLVEAWENLETLYPGEILVTPEGDFSGGHPSEHLFPKDADERLAVARRVIADRCLFGVDINPMAVEMAKLSIWLITVDRVRPFTFLDHALKCGDSLVGLTRLMQLETFSWGDSKDTQGLISSNYEDLVRTAIGKRRELELLPSDDSTRIQAKTALLRDADGRLTRLKWAADFLTASALDGGSVQKREMARVDAHLTVNELMQKDDSEFQAAVSARLRGQLPFHWPLEFPEIFDQGGFHAFIGNPPYMQGRRISSRFGDGYLSWLSNYHSSVNASSDLVVYFVLRAFGLGRQGSCTGMVTTQGIALGDTRATGLGWILSNGGYLYRATPDSAWPGAAAVRICAFVTWKGTQPKTAFLGDRAVPRISSYLSDAEERSEQTFKLSANDWMVYTGTHVYGRGFVLSDKERQVFLDSDSRNEERIRPFLRGEDVNNEPGHEHSAWIIDFGEMPEEEARQWPDLFSHLERTVAPERAKQTKQIHESCFWKFWDKRPKLYAQLAMLTECLVHSFVSKYVAFAFVSSRQVIATPNVVIPSESRGLFAVLQSSAHITWVERFASRMGQTLRYAPSDCLHTFPMPSNSFTLLDAVGTSVLNQRRESMSSRREGMTKIYNRFHDPLEESADVVQLRRLHVEMDQAVVGSYGWRGLDLGHAFRETKLGSRFVISDDARRTMLDRLLSFNHQRHEDEARTAPNRKSKSSGRKNKKSNANKTDQGTTQDSLY